MVEKIVNTLLDENTYIVFDEKTKKGFLIDPGSDGNVIEQKVNDLRVELKAVLLTHGHFDHILSAKMFQIKGVPVYVHTDDADKLCTKRNLGVFLGVKLDYLTPDVLLYGDEEIQIADMHIKVISTPGHSKGSVCFYLIAERILFSGDTLFLEDVGRSDFYDSNYQSLKASIEKKLFLLDDDVIVYPGHDDQTTIGHEKKFLISL